MQERRKNYRRNNERIYVFPFHLGNGAVVETDRRHSPDRRLNDISVEEMTCEEVIAAISKTH